ncbi:hypothetical protein ACFWVT_08085 [Streptomyces cyaneofuscatus]|uniref:hypothetical protein n=1 Tax=Streptomyces cyaneofuscatus TaxID=66883 RepID=UPI00365F479F
MCSGRAAISGSRSVHGTAGACSVLGAVCSRSCFNLAGNLDLETIQIALAPGDKPSLMGIRVMREHALMHGTMLSSVLDELSMDSRGYVRAATYVDGRAPLLPLAQPGSGARHLYLGVRRV